MARTHEQKIFKQGSTTYYLSSVFFPANKRADVGKLYSFVRTADNYVDALPARPERLLALEQQWLEALDDPLFSTAVHASDNTDTRIVKNIVYVSRKYSFEPQLIADFLSAMKADINPRPYQTLDDTLAYIHGSAEVIGIMMAKLLGLPEASYPAAAMQGRAMQMINFIRDIAEDVRLGRCYFPANELAQHGFAKLDEQTARKHPEQFAAFVRMQLERYDDWQSQAMAGYKYIPRRYLVPIRTAADMYDWTAAQIRKDPFVVFEQKVKPTPRRVFGRAARRMIHG